MKVKISVVQVGRKYYASRTFPDNMPDYSPPGLVFSITEEVTNGQEPLEDRAKTEARKRGISHVVNLD